MSLLGIDVGTTGCKAVAFSEDGRIISSSYEEYDIKKPQTGWAELDVSEVLKKIMNVIRFTVSGTHADPVKTLAVSSLGEAMVPVSIDKRVLGNSILNFDIRGQEYVKPISKLINNKRLYSINGNTISNNYSLTKLMWVKDNMPNVYEKTYKFLLWGSFVAYMLGAEAAVDYSLANRTLLFDIEKQSWSEEILCKAGIDPLKMASTVPSDTVIGTVSDSMSAELGLPRNVSICMGTHDQCANALGCGVIEEGMAMYGIGTYICIVPVFKQRRETKTMIKLGLNTEHHVVPGNYVTFIYNQGGVLMKWFRDTFAAEEFRKSSNTGENIYAKLDLEMPETPSMVTVLPHFVDTGPPDFISDSSGIITGLKLDTNRGGIQKGILEGTTFYMRKCVESISDEDIQINKFRVAGGGSKSNRWVQLCADIMGKTFIRPVVTEAGALGAAIIAGTGNGIFKTYSEGVESMVRLEKTFEPDWRMHKLYHSSFNKYKQLELLAKRYLLEG